MIGAFATIARSENVQIAVQVVEPVVYGDRVQVQISYTNAGDKLIHYSKADGIAIAGVSVTNSQEKRIDLTIFGKSIRNSLVTRRRGISEVLRPNESADVLIGLNLYYDMTVPDDYRVVVKRGYTFVEDGKPRHVEMEPVTLDISYRPKEPPELGAAKQP